MSETLAIVIGAWAAVVIVILAGVGLAGRRLPRDLERAIDDAKESTRGDRNGDE